MCSRVLSVLKLSSEYDFEAIPRKDALEMPTTLRTKSSAKYYFYCGPRKGIYSTLNFFI